VTVSVVKVVYRIASETPEFTAEDLSGGGAAKVGGRWNAVGTPVVYCAGSRALAYVETLAHLIPGLAPGTKPPGNSCLIEVSVPMAIWDQRHHARKDPKFPSGWNVHPAGKGSIDYGTAWLAGKTSALLVVPSVVVPAEDNILINPVHPDAKAIKAKNTGQWQFDHRLFP
jgi:RES domain-containing protein